MNLDFLHMGRPGALEAGLIALLAGVVIYALVHALGRRLGWSHAGAIGRTFVVTLLVAASVDIWNLLYMGIVPMQSPVTIRRILADIHDPDFLGMRVVCEIIGAMLGSVLGWLLWGGSLRARLRALRSRD